MAAPTAAKLTFCIPPQNAVSFWSGPSLLDSLCSVHWELWLWLTTCVCDLVTQKFSFTGAQAQWNNSRFLSHESHRFREPSELIRATAQIRKMTVVSRNGTYIYIWISEYLNVNFDDMLACVHPEPLSTSQNEFCIFKVGVQQRFLQTTGYLYKCYVSTTLHPKLQNATVSAKLCSLFRLCVTRRPQVWWAIGTHQGYCTDHEKDSRK